MICTRSSADEAGRGIVEMEARDSSCASARAASGSFASTAVANCSSVAMQLFPDLVESIAGLDVVLPEVPGNQGPNLVLVLAEVAKQHHGVLAVDRVAEGAQFRGEHL